MIVGKTNHKIVLLILLLILALSCSPLGSLGGRSQNQEEIEWDGSTGFDQNDPATYIGDTLDAGSLEIFLPPDAGLESECIVVKPMGMIPANPPEDSIGIGESFEIDTQEEIEAPLLLTINYDPQQLPLGGDEDNLYIAYQTEKGWVPVEGGYIDKQNHTVNASVDHFSRYGIFSSLSDAIYDTAEYLFGDEIIRRSYSELPGEVQNDLINDEFNPQDVKAVVHLKTSAATRGASAVISFANGLSKTAGLAIAALEDSQDAVLEAIALTAADAVFEYTGSQAGSFALAMYDSASLGKELGEYAADTSEGNPQILAAKLASWLLAREMEYINTNMDQAFSGIWKFNLLSSSRLQILAVYIDAEPWQQTMGAKGVKFYYYNESKKAWVNYYDNMVFWKLRFQLMEKESDDQQQAVKPDTPPDESYPQSGSQSQPGSTQMQPYASQPTATREKFSAPTATFIPTGSPTMTATPTPTRTPTPTDTPTLTKTATEKPPDISGVWDVTMTITSTSCTTVAHVGDRRTYTLILLQNGNSISGEFISTSSIDSSKLISGEIYGNDFTLQFQSTGATCLNYWEIRGTLDGNRITGVHDEPAYSGYADCCTYDGSLEGYR